MKHLIYLMLLVLSTDVALGQSPFVPLGPDYYHLIDRLEIRQGRWADGFHSSVKPYNRHSIIQLADSIEADETFSLSDTDYFNLQYLRDDSWEWVKPADTTRTGALRPGARMPGDSRQPLLGTFYRKKADFYSVQTADFDLHVNPVLHFGFGRENNESGGTFVNTRGLEVRGTIAKRLGFYTYLADNQAVFPRYIEEYGRIYGRGEEAGFAPGEGDTKRYVFRGSNRGADFLSARGYFTFNFLKIVNLQFGHDRNFIGNGFRSLLLSDNSAPYLFLRLTTRFGKHFQYTNLFSELQNTQVPATGNDLWPQKFMAMHHLSANIGRHVNIGVFEAQVFSRDRLDLNYLNPIIFYRSIEAYRGSRDNAFIGIDAKGNFLRKFLVYGQLLIDEFKINAFRQSRGTWLNKTGVQLGAKYVDAFGISNLDLQAEYNAVRPFTYSHRATLNFMQNDYVHTNYVHFNQPMAHPLGANFREYIGIARYQWNRLNAVGTFGVMQYGTDPPGRNYGGNLLLDYNTRTPDDNNNRIAQGRETIVTYAELRLSYMFKHNLFLDGRYLYRLQDSQFRPASYATNLASFAIRWNLPYRNWVF